MYGDIKKNEIWRRKTSWKLIEIYQKTQNCDSGKNVSVEMVGTNVR